MLKIEVMEVTGSDNWESNFGPMVGWSLTARVHEEDGSTRVTPIELNAKPTSPAYVAGMVFFASEKGSSPMGALKVKREQPPQGREGEVVKVAGGAAPLPAGTPPPTLHSRQAMAHNAPQAAAGAQRGLSEAEFLSHASRVWSSLVKDRISQVGNEPSIVAAVIEGCSATTNTYLIAINRGEVRPDSAAFAREKAAESPDAQQYAPPPTDDGSEIPF